MTAFIALKYPDRVELMADGAVYAEDGTLMDIRPKISAGRSLAVVTRGNATAGKLVADAIAMRSMASGFDATMEWLQETLSARSGQVPEFGFELVVAGISETEGPIILYATTNSYMDGIPAWTLLNAGSNVCGGHDVPLVEADFEHGLFPAGVAAIDLMRQSPGVNPVKPDLPPVYGIGGHIDHAVVRADGVTLERVHEWPEDVVGQKIEPRAVQKRNVKLG
ncbi:hypothetical protein [Agrobacterium salinitolerans]|uniref:hypothetical protein n=1 Tax=Agrobacterium salinitolerans TaxID=1183413 RepID=UPI001574D254|nr:hypothetical protein [Agrobacterium salinitolerans]NTA35980.1 hypothetical protein [Agrobacterium salinitolerans]